jgi:hypothetical protein
MSHLYRSLHLSWTDPEFVPRNFSGRQQEYTALLSSSCTLYVDFIPTWIVEDNANDVNGGTKGISKTARYRARLLPLFSMYGQVRRIHPGLDRWTKEFAGFALVEYVSRSDAETACHMLRALRLRNPETGEGAEDGSGRGLVAEFDQGYSRGRELGKSRKHGAADITGGVVEGLSGKR